MIYLYLYDWKKNSQFSLIVNLNELDAELAKKNPAQPDSKVKKDDKIKVEVFDLKNALLGKGELLLSDILDRTQKIVIDSLSHLSAGSYNVTITWARVDIQSLSFNQSVLVPDPVAADQPFQVDLKPTSFDYTPSKDLWKAIKDRRINFKNLQDFVNIVLCKTVTGYQPYNIEFNAVMRESAKNRLPFVNVDEYSLVKYAIDTYLRKALKLEGNAGNYALNPLPYYQQISQPLKELADDYLPGDGECKDRLESRLNGFLAIELIWSYWTEQAMLVQAMGAISLRYQNIRGLHEVEPMMRFDTSPLLPLSNLLWGFIQDEQHRTSLHRRSFEYQHAYNVRLIGKAVPRQVGVDNRSHFLSAFHSLLHQASLFFKEYDDKTRNADAFPLLISLRDVHLLLAEGNHNAYYNMTYTTRHEMLTMQYLLSQQEMQTFLGGRPMMPYETHIGVLDTVKTIQGWDPVGTLHYYELANAGEQIVLSIRFGNWNDPSSMFNATDAGIWAIEFRDLISTYINAYRNVTMVDLSADAHRSSVEERAIQPALLIQRRLSMTAPRSLTGSRQAARSSY